MRGVLNRIFNAKSTNIKKLNERKVETELQTQNSFPLVANEGERGLNCKRGGERGAAMFFHFNFGASVFKPS